MSRVMRMTRKIAATIGLCILISLGIVSPSSADTPQDIFATHWGCNANVSVTVAQCQDGSTAIWAVRIVQTAGANTILSKTQVSFQWQFQNNGSSNQSLTMAIVCMNTTSGNIYRASTTTTSKIGVVYPGWTAPTTTVLTGCAPSDETAVGAMIGGQFPTSVSPYTSFEELYLDRHNDAVKGWWVQSPDLVTAPPPPLPVGSHCRLTMEEIVGIARQAGFTGSDVATAAAIAYAESSGWVDAIGGPNTDDSYDLGLWQVNNDAHPSYDEESLLSNPSYTATAAFEIFTDATDFSPWVTFDTGAHEKYLLDAQQAAKTVDEGFSISSCANSQYGGGDVGDGNTEGDYNCSGWNPINYLKCLFIPQNGVEQWNDLQEEATTSPPLSLFISGISSLDSAINTLEATAETPCTGLDPWGGTNGCDIKMYAPGESGHDINATPFDPFTQAGIMMQNEGGTTPYGPWIYNMIAASIIFPCIWFVWTRLSKSFGGKEEV